MLPVSSGGVRVKLKVIPNAPRDEIVGWRGDALTVKVAAPPVEGKANRALIKFLAEVLGVRPVDVSIVQGETSRSKSVHIAGISAAQARERLKKEGPDHRLCSESHQ
jgi:uncharacterized protein (TIGR00251 family)